MLIFLVSDSIIRFTPFSFVAIALVGLACLVGLGLWTRIVALLSVAMAVWASATGDAFIANGLVAYGLNALVLAICGPGAFSLDARLFGRSTVHLAGPINQVAAESGQWRR